MNNNGSSSLEIYELYSIWYTPWWKSPFFIAFCVIGCALILIGFAYWIYKKLNKKKPLTPFEHCLEQLNTLNPVFFASAQKSDEFYILLTDSIKKYMGILLKDSKTYTDIEFIDEIQKRSFLPAVVVDQFKVLVEGAQYSKFAQHHMAVERMKDDLALAYEFIHHIHTFTQAESVKKSRNASNYR